MTRLFQCNTHYGIDPPMDINPLILEKYQRSRVLVLCAREQQCQRIYKLMQDVEFYPDMHLVAYGWWEAEKMGLVDMDELCYKEVASYDAVIVLNRNRIHPLFAPLLEEVEELLECKLLLPEA